MSERVLKCPQCTGPLKGGSFTRSTVCPYCGSTVVFDEERAVSAARFQRAWEEWNAPDNHGYERWFTLDGGPGGADHWALGPSIARGELSDVYYGQRARRPTERVLVKVLRDPSHRARFDHEWQALEALRDDGAAAGSFLKRLPRPVARGVASDGPHAGAPVMLLAWKDGFRHTFEAVRRHHPGGIPPRSAVWVWRRILEVLRFHQSRGMTHGAVLPPHLLVQQGEHGVLLVGYSRAGDQGRRRGGDAVVPGQEAFYPDGGDRRASIALDVAMSARCVAYLLGGEADGDGLPDAVPEPLAELVRERCRLPDRRRRNGEDVWELRKRLGTLARDLFGPPAYCPIDLPQPPPPALDAS